MTLNTYRIACMRDVAHYRNLALKEPLNKHLYIHLAHVWLKRARLASEAINNRDPFKVKIQHDGRS